MNSPEMTVDLSVGTVRPPWVTTDPPWVTTDIYALCDVPCISLSLITWFLSLIGAAYCFFLLFALYFPPHRPYAGIFFLFFVLLCP